VVDFVGHIGNSRQAIAVRQIYKCVEVISFGQSLLYFWSVAIPAGFRVEQFKGNQQPGLNGQTSSLRRISLLRLWLEGPMLIQNGFSNLMSSTSPVFVKRPVSLDIA
jgi:hypothetical protein